MKYTCLRYRRREAFLGQEELAAAAHLTQQTISSIEHGRTVRPRPKNIRALADALGISPKDLFTDDPSIADGPEAGDEENVASNRAARRVA